MPSPAGSWLAGPQRSARSARPSPARQACVDFSLLSSYVLSGSWELPRPWRKLHGCDGGISAVDGEGATPSTAEGMLLVRRRLRGSLLRLLVRRGCVAGLALHLRLVYGNGLFREGCARRYEVNLRALLFHRAAGADV